jgi:hypothetical protein
MRCECDLSLAQQFSRLENEWNPFHHRRWGNNPFDEQQCKSPHLVAAVPSGDVAGVIQHSIIDNRIGWVIIRNICNCKLFISFIFKFLPSTKKFLKKELQYFICRFEVSVVRTALRSRINFEHVFYLKHKCIIVNETNNKLSHQNVFVRFFFE